MRRWVSFSAIKNAVTMEQALARYGILLKPAGFDTLRGPCPLPMHESDSVHSFSVDTRRNIWACHSESCIRNREAVSGEHFGLYGFDGALFDSGGGAATARWLNRFTVGSRDTGILGRLR